MEKVFILGAMEIGMKDHFGLTRGRGKAYCTILLVGDMKGIGKMTKRKETGFCSNMRKQQEL